VFCAKNAKPVLHWYLLRAIINPTM
jgi:hypothetical protein